MSTEQEEKQEAQAETKESSLEKGESARDKHAGGDPVRLWGLAALVLCLVAFFGHILADKFIPYTSNARIEAFVIPIVPQVSGTLLKVDVVNNQFVKSGQVLAVIDPQQYKLALKRAQADLQNATQISEADVAAVTSAQAKVAEARANLQNAEVKGRRIIKLSKQGAASMSRADDARTKIAASRARLDKALSDLERAKSKLGQAGADNAKVKAALAALEKAQLDLQRTTIRAPADGVITNLLVDAGYYASAGAPIMTFIATKFIWVQADMRENCLANITKGDPVDMVLDVVPGRIFKGEVLSVGYGVADSTGSNLGGLATVNTSQGWLRQAQHMPVLIRFADDEAKKFARVGGQVNVIIYTGDHPLMNMLGRLWIRLVSVLSYAY